MADRVGQTAVKLLIEPILDPLFHADSYGYRPKRSAKQAVAITRQRCWKYDGIVEFDIKAAFDQIDHALLLKAIRKHIKEDWIVMYIERWLTAPFETAQGIRLPRSRGTPSAKGEWLVRMQAIASRLAECGLTMHPEKSKIVYCKDRSRTQASGGGCGFGAGSGTYQSKLHQTTLSDQRINW